ncbi:ESX-1 secretion system ATPase EccB1 [Catellatospora citrea]|uniref:ESX-1 secretion system ATPase EccB1 n=1 Tax=Catellatospora citrea TaxID=53366 RepID=A0A8J3KW87_9ACTN|nr:ESX-1 secretion system ATPase EccB1 [Catellatospora citrea]
MQAQSYVLGRLTSALIAAEPEAPENPNRRTVNGTLIGILIGALLVAAFAIYGYLVPGGSDAWRRPGVLVVERETGTRYVLVDGVLRPVLNFTSARLLLGANPQVVMASVASLKGVPHGQPLGVVGAPDALPPADGLAGTAWVVCAVSAKDNLGTVATATTVSFGPGQALTAPLEDKALVAATSQGRYLIWRGTRFKLTLPWLAGVFGHEGDGAPVEAAWLDVLTAGPDLTPIAVTGRGEAGPAVDGQPTTVGQLFTARSADSTRRHYLLQRDGLSLLTDTAYAIASADPQTVELYGGTRVVPVELSAAALAQLPRSSRPVLPDGLPEALPSAVAPSSAEGSWCLRKETGVAGVQVGAHRPPDVKHLVAGTAVTRTARTAAAVQVLPGTGGLVRPGRAGQTVGATVYLVTDAGVKFQVADAQVAEALGLQPSLSAVELPELLDLLPTGPVLNTTTLTG